MVDDSAILALLDAASADAVFPDLDHGYSYAIDCRLHAFGDGSRWALVVETVGYNPRSANVVDVLHCFGNCLTPDTQGPERDDFLPRVENIAEIEDRDEPEIFTGGRSVRVRGRDLRVDAAEGTDLVEVFRSLVPTHRELLLATESELRRRLPADLPRLLVLDEWHQPDLVVTPPSGAEVYRQVAAVLASGDADRYRPSQAPNTHWSNWPGSGSL